MWRLHNISAMVSHRAEPHVAARILTWASFPAPPIAVGHGGGRLELLGLSPDVWKQDNNIHLTQLMKLRLNIRRPACTAARHEHDLQAGTLTARRRPEACRTASVT